MTEQIFKIIDNQIDLFLATYEFDYKRRLGNQQQIGIIADDIRNGFQLTRKTGEFFTFSANGMLFNVAEYIVKLFIEISD